ARVGTTRSGAPRSSARRRRRPRSLRGRGPRAAAVAVSRPSSVTKERAAIGGRLPASYEHILTSFGTGPTGARDPLWAGWQGGNEPATVASWSEDSPCY